MPNFLKPVAPLAKDRGNLDSLVSLYLASGGKVRKCPDNRRTLPEYDIDD